jgi:hypothetical protein
MARSAVKRTWRKADDKEEITALSHKLDQAIERFGVSLNISLSHSSLTVLADILTCQHERKAGLHHYKHHRSQSRSDSDAGNTESHGREEYAIHSNQVSNSFLIVIYLR